MTNALIARQAAAIARAKQGPITPFPGGVADRAAFEYATAAVLKARHDAAIYENAIRGHEMCGQALAEVAMLAARPHTPHIT
ncbi:hypothetical protein [Mycobacterium sp. SP-6446]|uniref:hypothetical protein n=1 Tax=Mycobacterium sp. SP-6446 TaxID=1834162 RepID=UPI00097016F3|nr:hypothetical protein [Mycobacterium sp. SP-6446]OMC17185.1 hypothetical protein A5736_16805 [Mycobacterium sp. SP-6446]